MEKRKEHLMKQKKKSQTVESQYVVGEDTVLLNDIYGMTIAANMTKNTSPNTLIISLRYCFIVFVI